MLADFGKTLARFKVPEGNNAGLVDIVNSTQSQIVVAR